MPSFTTQPWGSRHGFGYPLTEGQPTVETKPRQLTGEWQWDQHS